MTYDIWKNNMYNNNDYSCTDYNNLINLINETIKSNNKIIIITARENNLCYLLFIIFQIMNMTIRKSVLLFVILNHQIIFHNSI